MGPSRSIDDPGGQVDRRVELADPDVRRVMLHAAAILLTGGAAGALFAIGWHSPVRVVLVLAFLLFGPGLALGELLELRDPVQRLAVATGASLALETIVGVALLYAGAYSPELVFAIVLGISAAVLAAAVVRSVRMSAVDDVDYSLRA
jgi:uncharacterized membrane protein